MSKLIGYVRSLDMFDTKTFWFSPDLYHYRVATPTEVPAEISNVGPCLSGFLKEKALSTKETINKKDNTVFKLISLAELKAMYCSLRDEINNKETHNVLYVQYQFYDQLNDLIKQIEVIAQLGLLLGSDIYLKFYFK